MQASRCASPEMPDSIELLKSLSALPGGGELLALAADREDVELVGGAVRDILLGRTPRELDVVVCGTEATFLENASSFARDLASHIEVPSAISQHERFGTALVVWDGGRIDIATRRAESYAAPGALPTVRAGTPEEDLQRRDFTLNAIAISLSGPRPGSLRQIPRALEDLAARRLRVLHEQSFLDDPTRLLRMARYAVRLRLEIEPGTGELARAALAQRALETVSGARIGAELRLALGEAEAVDTLAAMSDLGLLDALHPRLRFEEQTARNAIALLPSDGRIDLTLLISLVLPLALRAGDDPRAEIFALLDRWEFPAADRDLVATAAAAIPRLIDGLPRAESPSMLRAAALGVPLEGLAIAATLGCEEPARRWLEQTRHVRLEITGEDLLAAGIPEGPDIGRRLEAALKRRLDGELAEGSVAELKAALDDRQAGA
jgi:tRNA nucleotidyltransferase (CCA-adding enzyme)